MSQQLDQMLLMYEPEEKEAPAAVLPAEEIGRIKERLRVLEDLKRHKGYQILMEALRGESQHCLISMDKAEKGNQIVKFSANYYSLTMAMGYVDAELQRLVALLKGAKAY
jgi:hypothetical protein